MHTRLSTLLVILFILGCKPYNKILSSNSPNLINILDSLLQSNSALFGNVTGNKDSFRLQIIYTQINRDAQNNPSFINFTYNLNDEQYFYPASTVKMPVALLALEKLNEIKIPGLNKQSAMVTDSSFPGQKKVFTHATAQDSKPSIEQYIKEIFLVSDNDAFNRLYEFLGQHYINQQLHKKGYTSVDILHRLNISLSEQQNRYTNAIAFYDTSGAMIYKRPAAYNADPYRRRNTFLGKGYYQGGALVTQPFDFSKKNRISLSDLHGVLRSIIFPDAVKPAQRFNLNDSDYTFLHRYMSMYPGENTYPRYDTAQYCNAYVKFLLHGSAKGDLPQHLRVFNKVGDAYGFLTDVAYVVDFKNKVEWMLSATIFCNAKGIFNSNDYEYEQVGLPFMKSLGQVIYDYELKRKRLYTPDLSRFIFEYDQ